MASSTTRPTDSTMARMVSRLRLKPKAYMKIAAPIRETGMATSGTSAVRTEPMKRKTTKPTIRIVSPRVLVISVQRVLHEHRRAVDQLHVDVFGQRRPDPLHLRLEPVRHLDLVDADQRPDAEIHAVLGAVLGDEVGLLGSQLDVGDVAQADDGPVPVGHDQVLELLHRAQVGVGQQVDLDQVALGLPDRGEVVVAPERGLHVARRQVERRQPLGIDPDPHRDLASALDASPAARRAGSRAAAGACATASR